MMAPYCLMPVVNIKLQRTAKADTIATTTKYLEAICSAFKRAFFVPEIRAFLPGLVDLNVFAGMKNRFRNFIAGGLIGLNTRPFKGNKSSRLGTVVEARPPVPTGASGQTLTKYLGGQAMPLNTSFRHTIGDYQLSISLPAHAFIREFVAAFNGSDWTVSVITTKDQVALIKDREGRPMRFHTLDIVARFLAEQGAPNLSVSLLGLTNGGAE